MQTSCSLPLRNARKHLIQEILPTINHIPPPPFSGNLLCKIEWRGYYCKCCLLFSRVYSPLGEQCVVVSGFILHSVSLLGNKTLSKIEKLNLIMKIDYITYLKPFTLRSLIHVFVHWENMCWLLTMCKARKCSPKFSSN